MLAGVARARTVARLGAAIVCGLLLAGTLGACGGTKTVTKTVTVVGTVPNGGATSVSANVVEGALLYQRYGCVNCHGPNGLGGVPNPQSPDKAIPALSGADFFKEFNTDQKIIDVIRSGSVIGRAPIVSMPHWGGIIPDSQLRALVAYIKTLKTG